MKIKTEAGSAEEQPAMDISSGDEVIRFILAPVYRSFLWITFEPFMPKKPY
jgi:hypothetical protein